VRNDASRMGESSALTVSSDLHDEQVWSCKTQIRKLTIPRQVERGLLTDLWNLENIQRMGIQRVDAFGDLRNVGELEAKVLLEAGIEPEFVEINSNLLMYGGASCQWQTLLGNGTATAGQALTFFNNAQAAIGVGDSTTAAAATQTDLVAATNKLRKAMDATYPQHTDGVVVGSASIVFRSTFATGDANFAWQEWGIFNSATAATGRMLNRKVESLGTKTSASTWTLTLTLTLA
jgi:hypothetical protein